MIIHTAGSRTERLWDRRRVTFDELAGMVANPRVTQETAAEFAAMPKEVQDDVKDVGGFVMAELRGGRRTAGAVESRTGAALDADSVDGQRGLERLIESLEFLARTCGFEYCLYSTRKSAPETPRVRILIPFLEPVCPAAGEACSLKLCENLGMENFDPTTCEPNRLMYWPSVSSDGLSSFLFKRGGCPGEALDAELFLKTFYDDWRDRSEWPAFPGQKEKAEGRAERQADPLSKEGIVGQFCRAHTIQDAIAKFLPEVYEPAGGGGGRYTHIGSTTTGGAVVYDDRFLYSHHASDPAAGRLMNAYDMVRIHLFGDGKKSDDRMRSLAGNDPDTVEEAKKDQIKRLDEDFAGIDPDSEGFEFVDRLERSPKNPNIVLNTISNAYEVFLGDPRLKGRYYLDEFTGRMMLTAPPPWSEPNGQHPREWTKMDEAGARLFFEREYRMKGEKTINDGIVQAFCAKRKHPLKDYLDPLEWDGVKRLDTLFIDYLGAEDNAYVRAVTRKSLTAAVARVYEPGRKFDTMTILCGVQGLGKSTLLATLGGEWFSDSLEEFSGKDAFMQVEASWIIEIGELQGFNAYEMRTIKRFLSKQSDSFRAPFERQVSDHKRHAIFFGTTNDEAFLRDKTGNRRFWPVTVKGADVSKIFTELPALRDQIWAEAKAAYESGESLILSPELEEMANSEREVRMEDDPLQGKIIDFIASPVLEDWAKVPVDTRILFYDQPEAKMFKGEPTVRRDKVCAAEVFAELYREPPGRMDKRRTAEINRILSGLSGLEKMKSPRRFGAGYGNQRGYYVTDEFYESHGYNDSQSD